MTRFLHKIGDAAMDANPIVLAKFLGVSIEGKGHIVTEFALGHIAKRKAAKAPLDSLDQGSDLRVGLVNLCRLLDFKINVAGCLSRAVWAVSELELMRRTSRGRKAMVTLKVTLPESRHSLLEYKRSLEDLAKTAKAEEDAGGFSESTIRKVAIAWELAPRRVENFVRVMRDLENEWVEALEHGAEKAVVLSEADKDEEHQRLKHSLEALDQGINLVQTVGEVLGNVPEEHVKTAAFGLSVGGSVCEAGKAVVDKMAMSIEADRMVDRYRESNRNIYADLDADPYVVAKRLADKRKSEIEIALTLTKPVWTVASSFMPSPVGEVWPRICDTILDSVEAYNKTRLALAKREFEAGAPDVQEVLLRNFGEDYKELLKEKARGNVFSVLNPFRLLTETAVDLLTERIVKCVFQYLPPEPAELFDGATLRNAVADIVEASIQSPYLVLQVDSARFAPPLRDNQGRRVETVLSDVKDLDTRAYQYVRLEGGLLGRLYREDETFEDLGVDDELSAPLSILPTTDDRNRRITSIYPDTLRDHPTLGYEVFKAKIDKVIGWLEVAAPHRFTPDQRDDVLTSWRMRSITATGYTVLFAGRKVRDVAGTWYRPFPGKENYLFVGADGTREWASGPDVTGDGGKRVSDVIRRVDVREGYEDL